ncbi:MAG: AmmeMemoRadiSam system protein B [Candidatus Binatia bacterium]
MDERPHFRPVEVFPVQEDGKTFVCLRDPQHFSPPLVVSPVGYFILYNMDGRHTLVDIQEAYARNFSRLLLPEDLKKFIEMMDENHYLFSERFFGHQRRVIEDFRRQTTRLPAHVGGVYRQEPAELSAQLHGYFLSSEGPGLPDALGSGPSPRAVVAPHIDFHRGGPCYAWAYREIIDSEGADLYVLLGTSHCPGESPFVVTSKDFETPLGAVETDREFVNGLQTLAGADLTADEFLHRSEHSLEFQVVFLRYAARLRAERGLPFRPFKIVPILVTSFHSMVQNRTLPENDPRIGGFLQALSAMVERERRRVCFIAGVDFAHVGPQFGDSDAVTASFLNWVETEDRLLIEGLAASDPAVVFGEIAKDQDRRRICGFSPLYSLAHLLRGSPGKLIKYGHAFNPDAASAVTFASMVYK